VTRLLTVLAFLLCLSFAAPTRAQDGGQPLDATATAATATLKNVPHFAVGGVGVAARMSPGEEALRVLLKHKQGVPALRAVLKEGNIQGQLYALLGLKKLAPAEFAKAVVPYRASRTPVAVLSGCMMEEEPVSVIVKRIETNAYGLILDREAS
jgi:hypothetical protein